MTPARHHLLKGLVAFGVACAVALVVVGVGVPLYVTSQPLFFERYRGLETRHTRLESSSHANIPCLVCHQTGRDTVSTDFARVGEFYRSLVTTSTDLAYVKFEPPTNAACLQCHTYAWSDEASQTAKVPHPAHLRTSNETRRCVSCHKWVAHEETYQAKHKTMPFSGVCASFACHAGTVQREQCGQCHHALAPDQTAWKTQHPAAVRAIGPNSCMLCHKATQCNECHTTGKASDLPSVVPTLGVTIESMHTAKNWLSVHGTQALKDQTVCTSCHVSNGECLDCHLQLPQFHLPISTWMNRHQKIATSKQDVRCITCHVQKWCDACHAEFEKQR